MVRMMTFEERREVSRAAFELGQQLGRNAHASAVKRAEAALSSGDAELAQFWKWVAESLEIRAGIEEPAPGGGFQRRVLPELR